MIRRVFLDVETTGLNALHGDRIVEVGCIEALGDQLTGRTFHRYCNPERLVSASAFAVHGLEGMFLRGQPLFSEIADDFLGFVCDAEIIIHNAPFDVRFINAELKRVRHGCINNYVSGITDSLHIARRKYPGQSNSLDALCLRFGILSDYRKKHGALQDAQLLASVCQKLKL